MNLGIIARADKTGLGNQTRNLVRMLQPFRVMVIDSRPFNGNEQYFETYRGHKTQVVRGFPRDSDVRAFLRGLDAVLTCETFYHPKFVDMANTAGVRTYNQYNYEFLDNLVNPTLALPTKLLSPSKWHLQDMKDLYGDRVEYLPPPTFGSDFAAVRDFNYTVTGKPRFLHVVGRVAVNDRNGTLDLLDSLKYTREDFELVLKVQTGVSLNIIDPRVTLDYSSPINEAELYRGFHALILPRRYAGLCLPMNEALMSGLPVLMTDIEPNNLLLPREWLAKAVKTGEFKTRTMIDLYSAYQMDLAATIDAFCRLARTSWFNEQRDLALKIANDNYSVEALKDKYNETLSNR